MGGNDEGSHGTGHEDEYQGGWSTFWLENPYSLPLFGEPKTENLIDVFGQVNGSTTVYRFWPGKIPHANSIRISTKHGNNNDTPATYFALVYCYFLLEYAPHQHVSWPGSPRATDSRTSGLRDEWLRTRSKCSV